MLSFIYKKKETEGNSAFLENLHLSMNFKFIPPSGQIIPSDKINTRVPAIYQRRRRSTFGAYFSAWHSTVSEILFLAHQ